MSANNAHGSEEPLISEDKIKMEEPEWRLSAEFFHLQYERKVKSRRYLVIYLAIFLPWILLIIVGSWSWIRYYKLEKSAVLAGQLTYSKFPFHISRAFLI